MTILPPVATISPLFPAALSVIDTSNRLRPVDMARVEALAASLSEIGQQQPIVVRPMRDGPNGLILVAGAHRVAAAKLLGWSEIAAIWIDPTDAEARLVEIDENLIRNELCEIDRAISLAERKRIYESLHPETAHGKAKKPKKTNERAKVANLAAFASFAVDAAKRTGFSTKTISNAVALAASLSPEAIALFRGSALADNQSQLKALSALDPADQVRIAREISEGRAKSFAAARVSAGMVPAGGVVRAIETPLMRIEPMLLRMSLSELQTLSGMVAVRIANATPPAKAAKPKKGDVA